MGPSTVGDPPSRSLRAGRQSARSWPLANLGVLLRGPSRTGYWSLPLWNDRIELTRL